MSAILDIPNFDEISTYYNKTNIVVQILDSNNSVECITNGFHMRFKEIPDFYTIKS